ncbi:DUF5689 domain-containing protein [Bizionia arctica]|uniref:DUF5689 domain-containing protein n=1 Tax=Bizionia arctica TaxID=1495645 RepID=A0A917GD09_9FLAO|nr:DUF5689 domain-containing protein [Bizionia arctica]GGG38577.1 hypothetical protein GCM10010976_07900 [Bizionia arctica]
MKTNKFLKIVLGLMVTFATVSCVQDDDYTVPTSQGDEESAALANLIATGIEVDMEYVKELYNSSPGIPFEVEDNIYVIGYVSSSDKTGNFFKEFFMQDSPSNPMGGLKVVLDELDSYNQFNQGRQVYISLKGTFIGEERVGNGIYTIGGGTEFDQYGGTVTRLNVNQVGNNLLRSSVTEEIVPLNVTFSEITDQHVGVFVQVDGVEFAANLNGLRYFDPIQVYDTQRTMQTCTGFGYASFSLETSSFANFKAELLPTGNGSIKAVVNKTFDGSARVLALNNVSDVNMNSDRCTPLDFSDFEVIYEEDFQSAVDGTNLDLPGWTNFAEAGSRVWREEAFQGNGYAEFSTFGSGDVSNIGWLVTPGFDMDAQENEFINFTAAQHHLDSPDNTIEVFVSTDYDGSDVLGATWEPLVASFPTQANSWYEFVDSGLIDVSSYSGTLYVAFKVTGSGTNEQLDGAYQVDNFVMLASM